MHFLVEIVQLCANLSVLASEQRFADGSTSGYIHFWLSNSPQIVT